MACALKAHNGQPFVGSNPTPAAESDAHKPQLSGLRGPADVAAWPRRVAQGAQTGHNASEIIRVSRLNASRIAVSWEWA